jgi:DNA replication protein DnaD
MEKFFKYFKEKLSLNDEHIYQLRNIVLNDNTALIKQNFNIFYENKAHVLNDSNFFYCSLFLYCLDIHREFKKKLLSVISSKLVTYKETNEFITNFLGYIDLDSISTKDINELKYKILLLNNLYDLSMKYFNSNKKDKKNESKNNNGNNDEKENAKIILLNKFFYFFINSFEKK